jgi:hypothetical protein
MAAEFASLARARFRSVHADILDNDSINGMISERLQETGVPAPRPLRGV